MGKSRSQYTPADRERAVRLMAKSAARSPDNAPNFTKAMRELQIPRQTLKVWWTAAREHAVEDPETEHDSTESLTRPGRPVARPPATDDALAEHVAWAQAQLGIPDAADHRVRLVAETRLERSMATSDTARAALTKELNTRVVDLRPTEPPRGVPTPSEWKAEAATMLELVLEVVLESDLVTDPRLVAAVRGGA